MSEFYYPLECGWDIVPSAMALVSNRSTSGSRTVKYSAQSVRFRREQKRHCSSRAERISDGDPCMVDLRCVHTSGSRELVLFEIGKFERNAGT